MDTKENSLIPFVGINLKVIQKYKDKALELTRIHYDTEPTGQEFETFVQDLYKAFPKSLRYDVFYASVMDMVGKRLTRTLIGETAWRLGGNMSKLKAGTPVPAWTHQTVLEWCPVTIVRGTYGHGYGGKPGFFYEYRVMAGLPAGKKFTLFWSTKFYRSIARDIGYKRTRKAQFKLVDGSELVQMRLYLLFDPKLSKEDRPVAYHLYVPPSFKAYNLHIIKQRYRITPCPEGYSLATVACHHCPFGNDKCPAACHPLSFKEKACPRCLKPDAWVDPAGRGIVCIDCEENERRGHHA